LLPVFNTKVEYLREAIDSILSQSFGDFELIIIDDASSLPDVKPTILSYNDPRIIFSENERNLGIALTRNKLLDLARGEYLAVMDHDDISLPDRFKKQVEFLDANPEVGVVGCLVQYIPSGKIYKFPSDSEAIEERFVCSHKPLHHPTVMIRKKILSANNLRYDQNFTPCEDYDLFCHLIGKTKFANIQEVLFYYRWQKQNTSYIQKYKTKAMGEKIKHRAMHEQPVIWQKVKDKIFELYHYSLFGFIPVLTVRRQGRKTLYLLFGVLPVLKRKYKSSVAWLK
jgi:glycosyltransferase involved in cell wall biosynthesis